MRTQFDDFLTEILYRVAALLVPLLLGLQAINLSISPAYPAYAYRFIAPDAHGFTDSERLDLALIAVAYLRHPAAAEQASGMLARQRLPGSDQPLFNERELAHLVDVKVITDAIRARGRDTAVLLAVIFTWLLSRAKTRPRALRAWQRGGEITFALVVALLVLALCGWPIFFIGLHHLLFPPGSWTFAGTESLIRLFPNAFWYGYGQLVLTLLASAAVFVYALGSRLGRPAASQRPQIAREAALEGEERR